MAVRNVRYRLARARADALLRATNQLAPPVDVDRIARHLGIEVVDEDFPEDDQISGVLLHRNAGPVILVNSKHRPGRRRFTIAHEIGHHQLQGDDLHVDKARYRDARAASGEVPSEIEANAFAADLLMPAQMIQTSVGKDRRVMMVDEDLVEALANQFKVSRLAMTWRLTALGYLK